MAEEMAVRGRIREDGMIMKEVFGFGLFDAFWR